MVHVCFPFLFTLGAFWNKVKIRVVLKGFINWGWWWILLIGQIMLIWSVVVVVGIMCCQCKSVILCGKFVLEVSLYGLLGFFVCFCGLMGFCFVSICWRLWKNFYGGRVGDVKECKEFLKGWKRFCLFILLLLFTCKRLERKKLGWVWKFWWLSCVWNFDVTSPLHFIGFGARLQKKWQIWIVQGKHFGNLSYF